MTTSFNQDTTLFRVSSAIVIVAVAFIVTAAIPAHAGHPAGGTCKHKGGLYSLCDPKESGKKCKRGSQNGVCTQQAKGCTCDTDRAPVLDNAITDFREAFDVILGSTAPQDCDQIAAISDHLTQGLAVLAPLVHDPDFVSTGFLARLDALLTDLAEVQAIAAMCSNNHFPGNIEMTLSTLKANYLPTFSDLLEQ